MTQIANNKSTIAPQSPLANLACRITAFKTVLLHYLLISFLFCFLFWATGPAHAGAAQPLVVGSEEDYPPFAIGNTPETASGFTVELWKLVAAESGINYVIRVGPSHEILQQFKDGKIDVLINLAESGQRRQFADFSAPHVIVRGAIFARKGESGIHSEADLAKKSIIVIDDDLAHDYALSQGWRKQLVLVKTAEEGLKLLASGEHGAMLMGKLAGRQTMGKLKLSNIEALNVKTGFSQNLSFAVHSGNPDLLARINKGLALTRTDGAYDKLYENWFGVRQEETSVQTLLKYMLPIVLILLVNAGITVYLFYKYRTERKQAEIALRQKERYQRALIDNFPFAVWLKDTQSRFLAVNQKFANTFGAGHPDELVGKTDFDVGPHDLAAGYQADDRIVLESRQQKTVEEEVTDQGVRKWFETYKAPVVDENGQLLGTVGFTRDISDRKMIETEFRVAAAAFESQEGMLVTDANNVVLRVNQAFTEITGYTAKQIVGKTPSLLKSDRHDAGFFNEMWENIKSTGGWRGEVWNRRKNGEIHPVWLALTAVTMEDGTISHYVATYTDITLRKAAEDEIKRLAFYDSLTQLPNRRLMIDRLQQALTAGTRTNKQSALLFIDLDDFKALNDTLGHDTGDMLLQQVAQRLAACIRKSDTAARLGGDEFVVVLVGLSNNNRQAATQAETVGEKILASLNKPYKLTDHELNSTPSIGITLSSSRMETVDDLLKRADIAMYQAKAAGRNTLRFFDPEMQAAVNVRVKLEQDLRHALAKGQLELYYQAQALHDHRIIGTELLLHWEHPERGLVLPHEFIPLAEETGLILPIGQWVLETACAQLKAWEKNPHTRHMQLAINVSPRQFRQPGFVDQVKETLIKYKINPDMLELELTESLVLDNVEDTVAKMRMLKETGLHFSMDDFGTGYSSLAYLTRLPIDKLKIDKSFVHNIGVKESDAIIVQTIIGMASNLGMKVIAEGVETEEQRKFLEQHGCHVCQGYIFGKPMISEEFEKTLTQNPKPPLRKKTPSSS